MIGLRIQRRTRRGIALVTVLMVITILSILVIEFHFNTRITTRISANVADELKAYYLAKSGIHIGAEFLVEDEADNNVDHLGEKWAMDSLPFPVGEGYVAVKITDEDTKINLNRLVRRSGRVDTRILDQLTQLLQLLGLDPNLANAIVDWADADTNHYVTGAYEDSAYGYNSTELPYPSKNNAYDTMAEVAFVAGMTPEAFDLVSPFLSVQSGRKININTADPQMIRAVILAIDPSADETLVDRLIEYREEDHFTQSSMRRVLERELGFSRALASRMRRYMTTRSTTFHIESTATVNEVTKKVTAIVQRRRNRYNILYWRVD